LGKIPAAVAAAQTNVIGSDSPDAGTALLRSLGQFQFPPQAHVEINPSGRMACTNSTSLGNLVLAGGRAEVAHVSAGRLNLASGSELAFAAVSATSHSLSVNAIGQVDDGVRARVIFPVQPLSGTTITLLKIAGADPIPKRFVDFPQALALTNGAAVYRVNYRGGDGNDLVLEKVQRPPTPAPPLRAVGRGNDSVTVCWPESSFGCELERLELVGDSAAWIRVPVAAPANGEYSLTISPLPGQPTAFTASVALEPDTKRAHRG
jgi:hypothetical protein